MERHRRPAPHGKSLGRPALRPQLTSFGLHSDYLSDTVQPAVSVAGLYNPSASFTLGQGHTDGVELNGIIGHRVDYAVGWVASSAASGLQIPNAQDASAHRRAKSGGVALDGEGKYGANVPDPHKPWAEKAITIDAFAYHGMSRADNGTGVAATPMLQNDTFNAVGGVIHGQYDSLLIRPVCNSKARRSVPVRRGPPTRAARPFLGPPVWRTPRESYPTTKSITSCGLVRAGRARRIHTP